jgi:hypothetical protein
MPRGLARLSSTSCLLHISRREKLHNVEDEALERSPLVQKKKYGVVGLTVASVLAFGAVTAGTALGISGCRSDPLVTLSNGYQVRLVAQINDSASNISTVGYKLHIPKGLTVTAVQYDNGPLAESFGWVADQPPVDNNGVASFVDQVSVADPNVVQTTVYATATQGAVEAFQQSTGPTGGNKLIWINQNFQFQPAGNSTCVGDFSLTGTVMGDLNVPAGVSCTVSTLTVNGNVNVAPGGSLIATGLQGNHDMTAQNGSSVQITGGSLGNNVNVQTGASLSATNLSIGNNLQGQQAANVNISGGSVGGQVTLNGLSRGASSLCGESIGQQFQVQNTMANASIVIGDPSNGCSGNTFGADVQLQQNSGQVTLSGSQISGNLTCTSPPSPPSAPNQTSSSKVINTGNTVNGKVNC